ncbi:MAG: hypothetical protein ACMG57_00710 [Candidatus Dojkabacteria bacterium]
MYIRYKQDKVEGAPEPYCTMDDIFNKILGIKVDEEAERRLKEY